MVSPITYASPVPVELNCVDPGTLLPLLIVGGIGEQQPEPPQSTLDAARSQDLLLMIFNTSPVAWVDDPSAGPKLAELVMCLADRSRASGGLGRIGVFAVATGTYVVRWALQELADSGDASAVLGVVAVAASDDGFWVDGPDDPALTQAQRDLRRLFVAVGRPTCEAEAVAPFDALCERPIAPESPFVVNSTAGSQALADLPAWPDGLPLLRIGGRLQVSTNVFGETYLPIGDVGDGAMDTPSATDAVVFDCKYNLVTALSSSKDTSCMHAEIRRSDQVLFEVASFVAKLRSEVSPTEAAFVLNCGVQTVMFAVLPLAPGSEVTAAISGYRVRHPSGLNYFQYGPDRPYAGGDPKGGQRTLVFVGDIEFDDRIALGDRITEGQVIGRMSDTPSYFYLGSAIGTAYVSAWVSPSGQGVIPPDNAYLASVYPFEVPDTCSN